MGPPLADKQDFAESYIFWEAKGAARRSKLVNFRNFVVLKPAFG